MSSHPTEKFGLPLARVLAIVFFAGIAPSVLLMAPAIAGQLIQQWGLSPSKVGNLFSIELAAMSLASLPALWWQSRFDWRKVATASALLFIAANLASALADSYSTLLWCRALSALGGGSLMVLCMASAASSPQRDQVYGLWVMGQLVLGAVGLWFLPILFAHYGLKALYLGLTLLMVLSLPLARAFPQRLQAVQQTAQAKGASTVNAMAVCAVLAILIFYAAISSVWTFIGSISTAAGISPDSSAPILATASLLGIAGSFTATLIGSRLPRRLMLFAGFIAITVSALLLWGQPDIARFGVAAMLFKFTWTFVLPFMLAAVAEYDSNGRLMSVVNLVIGGGLALGPAIAGPLIESRYGFAGMLFSCAVCFIVALLLIAGRSSRPSTDLGIVQ